MKFEYRGQKTHGTKLLALIQLLLPADGTEEEFEQLVNTLFQSKSFKVAKIVVGKLQRFFPSNPVFALVAAKLLLSEKKSTYQNQNKVRSLLNLAKELIRTSKNPEHQLLLDDVEEGLRAVPELFNPFEFIFGGR